MEAFPELDGHYERVHLHTEHLHKHLALSAKSLLVLLCKWVTMAGAGPGSLTRAIGKVSGEGGGHCNSEPLRDA